MASPPRPGILPESDLRLVNQGTVIFSYICVGLTGSALLAVCVFYCQRIARGRAPVTDAGAAAEGGPSDAGHRASAVAVDVAKLPEFAYTRSARHSGGGGGGDGAAQCSVCLGAVHVGEMVRLLPVCRHLYHVECIDMWLASHATCPLCRSEVDVDPLADGHGRQAAPMEEEEPPQAPPV